MSLLMFPMMKCQKQWNNCLN
uniref:Uncharacterized protein n=1 Tax=Arundo donax TaxID=35708 RepID=A0A0A9ASH5_ARUDO